MKIIVVVRTLNEERNIAEFCVGYDWADMILVSDGGSADETVEIAEYYPNAHMKHYAERVDMPDDPNGFMNPEPAHLNFTIDWAIDEGADWIILDGADCWPNPALKCNARRLLEGTEKAAAHLHRLYMWGDAEYFPKYNVSHALWGWRPALIDIRYEDDTTATCFDAKMTGIDPSRALLLDPPYVCLHHFAPDEKAVQLKMRRYKAWGHPQIHPLESIYAPPEPLPEWVYA